jgi:hypothetical protein
MELDLHHYREVGIETINRLGLDIDLRSVDFGEVDLSGKEGLNRQYTLGLACRNDQVERFYASLLVLGEEGRLVMESHLANPDAIWVDRAKIDSMRLRVYVHKKNSDVIIFYDMKLDSGGNR